MGAFDMFGSQAYPGGGPQTVFDYGSSAPSPFSNPTALMLLGLGQGLLKGGAPSPFPVGFGGALAQGMQGALSNAMLGQQAGLQQQHIQALQLANRRAQMQQDILDRYMGGNQQPTPQMPQAAPPGISGPSLQSAFPGMPSGEAGALSMANTPQQMPQQPQSYFEPREQYMMGRMALLAGLPGGGEMINSALSHDPSIALQMPDETAKLLHLAGISPSSAAGQAAIRQKLNPPVVNRGFGMGTIGPSGQYVSDPESEAQILRTETRKAGLETVPVTSASGATVPTFKSQLPGFPSAQGTPQMTPAPVQAPRPFAAPAPQPVPNPGDPWSTMPKLETPTGLGQTTYQKGRAEGAASLAGELSKKTADAAGIANERLVYNTQALDLVNTATTGKGALSIANVKNFLHSRLQIPLETLDKVVAGDANATTALNKDLINAATQKAKQAYGSRITQSEVMLQIKQASPNVDQLTATIKYLLQTDSAMSQYQIQKAQDLGRFLKQGGDPYQFEGWHSKTFPMSAAVSGVHLNAGSSSNIDALLKKYGKP